MINILFYLVFYATRQVYNGDSFLFNQHDGFLILFDASSPESLKYALDFKNSFGLNIKNERNRTHSSWSMVNIN